MTLVAIWNTLILPDCKVKSYGTHMYTHKIKVAETISHLPFSIFSNFYTFNDLKCVCVCVGGGEQFIKKVFLTTQFS